MERNTKDYLANFIVKYGILALAFILVFLFGVFIYCGSFYVHEGGHFLYGTFQNILDRGNASFYFSEWKVCPFFNFPIPQQTKGINAKNSLNFALGGSILILILTGIISYNLYKYTKRKIYLLLFPLFLLHEILGNFICGTDNYLGQPLINCSKTIIPKILNAFGFLFGIYLFFIFYPHIIKFIDLIKKKFNL